VAATPQYDPRAWHRCDASPPPLSLPLLLPHLAPTPCVVLHMSGWMWSHGYDYHNRNRDREAVMKGLLQKSSADVMNKLYAFSGCIPCSMSLKAHSTANMSSSPAASYALLVIDPHACCGVGVE
jgi:hypothetical protein